MSELTIDFLTSLTYKRKSLNTVTMPQKSHIPECATSTEIEFVLCSFAVGFDYEEKLFNTL